MASRWPPGRVRDAIVSVLEEAGRPVRTTDIVSAVSARLGDNLPASSVRSYLRLNEGSAVYRVGRGQYALPDAVLAHNQSIRGSYKFNRAELFWSDCISWLQIQPPNSIEAVVTDPPYGLVEYRPDQQAKLRAGSGGVWRIPPSYDGHQRSPLPRFTTLTDADLRTLELFFLRWATALHPVLVPGAHVVVASNPLMSYLVSGALARAGFERRGEIVRLVMTMRGGDRPKNAHEEFADVTVMPRSMWEPWLLFRKRLDGRVQDNLRRWKTGGLRRTSTARPFGDVIQSRPASPSERRLAPHPTLKPQAFLRHIVRAALPFGEGTVLDPFAGSGSTLAAADAVGYRSIGIELDEHYFEMAKSAIPALASILVGSVDPIRA